MPTKPPETQPDSVDNAERLMNEAALGQRPKRPPITVAPADDGDRFWIVDGNATYGVAERHGWETLPCHVIQSPDLPG